MAQQEGRQVVVATFEHPSGAEFALGRVQLSQVRLHTHAVLERAEGGGLRVRDASTLGAGKGALIGAVASLLIPGVGLVGGAIVGGLLAKLSDNDEQMRRLGQGLSPSSSALVLVVDPPAVAVVRPILEQVRGTVAVSGIDDDLNLPGAPE
jgi:uncharacterized membrane protein